MKLQKSYMKRRDRYLARGVNRKLMKAQRMFERRHKNRVKLIRSASNESLTSLTKEGKSVGSGRRQQRLIASALTRHKHEVSHHERVRMLAASGSSCTSGDEDNAVGEDESVGGSGSLSVGAKSFSDEHGYHSFWPTYNVHTDIRDSHTLPSFAMESVSHDQMPFAHGEIRNVPYVHGGFFGAAPFMLTNPHWIAILRILMPDVYVEISRRAAYAPAPKWNLVERCLHWNGMFSSTHIWSSAWKLF